MEVKWKKYLGGTQTILIGRYYFLEDYGRGFLGVHAVAHFFGAQNFVSAFRACCRWFMARSRGSHTIFHLYT